MLDVNYILKVGELIDMPNTNSPVITQTQCDHVIGVAWDLNDQEGPSFVRVWARESKPLSESAEWAVVFDFCPVCGEKNKAIEGPLLSESLTDNKDS